MAASHLQKKELRAQPVGQCSDRLRLNRGGSHMPSAMRKKAGTFTPARTFVPKITEVQAAQKFSAVILHLNLSAGELAQGAGRSKDCGKGWKSARSAPNLASMINLCRENKLIWQWLKEQIEGHGEHPDDPRLVDAVYRRVMQQIGREQ